MRDLLQGLGLEQYTANFKRHNISLDILPHLTPPDWSEIGVAAIGDRRRLLNAIGELPPSAAREEGRFARAPPTRRSGSPAHKSPARSRSRSRSRGSHARSFPAARSLTARARAAAGGVPPIQRSAAPARSRSRSAQDVEWWWATRRVLVIGDSITRGLEAIFRSRGYVSTSWTLEVHVGTEALTVKKNQDDYDLVIHMSAGNGLWARKGKQQIKGQLKLLRRPKDSRSAAGHSRFLGHAGRTWGSR